MQESEDSMSIMIRLAYEHPDEIRQLFSAYTAMLNAEDSTVQNYPNMQHYGDEIQHLERKYGRPYGRLYIAYDNDVPAGCIGLRKIDDTHGEIKRFYVVPACRRKKIGTALLEKIIADAKEIGYACLLLDTLPFLQNAIRLHQNYGFQEIDKYNDSPMDTSIYMKLDM